VNVKALDKAFHQIEEQSVEFDGCNITVTDTRAVADCGGTARYIPRVGNKAERLERRRWNFSLHQVDKGWIIDTVDAR
jgi:hypothetical protein